MLVEIKSASLDMGFLLLSVVVLFLSLTADAAPERHLSSSYIDHINSKQTLWKAGKNFPESTPLKHLKRLLGVPLSVLKNNRKTWAHLPSVKHDADVIANLPVTFDSREKWPNCPSLEEIRDQGSCGSCWAFASVEVMTDRVCTFSNGTKNFHFSARDLISCCDDCGSGCHGGNTMTPYKYWMNEGIVSGGNYNSSQGCLPYPFPPCVHHAPGTKVNSSGDILPCRDSYFDTPKCSQRCVANYSVVYENDKSYAKNITMIVDGEDHIMAEIYLNGPVEAGLIVYADFFNYKSGVYVCPADFDYDNIIGGHAVKIIGWGVQNGTKYWQVANSWNNQWGDNGFFKIRRGKNDCFFENFISAGEPRFE